MPLWHHWSVRAELCFVLTAAGCGFHPSSEASPIDELVETAKVDAPADAIADAFAGVTFVQQTSAYSSPWESNSSTIAVTFSNAVAAGNVIALYVSYADNT